MNKSVFCVLILSCLASCATMEENMSNGVQPVQVEESSPIFHATLEDNTKVFVNETEEGGKKSLKVLWNANDYISIFPKTTRNKKYRFTGADGAASVDFEDVTESFGSGSPISYNIALYPYNANAYYYPADDYIHTTFPRIQAYRASSFGPDANLMVAKSNDTDLSFKNAGGYLCLQLFGSGINVRSVILNGNADESLSGPVKIGFTGPSINVQQVSGPVEEGMLEDLSVVTLTDELDDSRSLPNISFDDTDPSLLTKDIVLSAASPVELGSTSANSTIFWMAVPPLRLHNGFTVTVVDDNGRVYQKSTGNATTFERNKQIKMKAFELKPSSALAPLTKAQMGSHPVAGTGYEYNASTDQVNIYEQDGEVWARFLRIPSLTMIEIGPLPADVSAGTTVTSNVKTYMEGVQTEAKENIKLTVQSISGGIINLVSDEGTRYAIRF